MLSQQQRLVGVFWELGIIDAAERSEKKKDSNWRVCRSVAEKKLVPVLECTLVPVQIPTRQHLPTRFWNLLDPHSREPVRQLDSGTFGLVHATRDTFFEAPLRRCTRPGL